MRNLVILLVVVALAATAITLALRDVPAESARATHAAAPAGRLDGVPVQAPGEEDFARGVPLESAVVEAACGQCQFGLEAEGCDLAVRIDGRAWFVDGTAIDDHGDAHAEDGFCNAVRQARVSGRVEGDRFVTDEFELLDAAGG